MPLQGNPHKKRVARFVAALAISTAALMVGCATPGAPLPPSLQVPKSVEDFNLERKGARVVLRWTPPNETTDHVLLKRGGETSICRSVGRYPVSGCEVVKKLALKEVKALTNAKSGIAEYEDVIPANLLSPTGFATYALEVKNDRDRSAGLSNQLRVPLAPTMKAPPELDGSVVAQGPRLQWTATPSTMVAAPGVTYVFRVMRKLDGQAEFSNVQDLKVEPAGTRVFADPNFEWEKTYVYKIVPVTEIAAQGTTAAISVEGDDSPTVKIEAKDIFPPTQPSGVQAVYSGTGQKAFIDLSWTPKLETDLAGYNVFRHTTGTAAVKINAKTVSAPSFRDEDVQAGMTYFYSVSAVDLRGNESAKSEETSESVPK